MLQRFGSTSGPVGEANQKAAKVHTPSPQLNLSIVLSNSTFEGAERAGIEVYQKEQHKPKRAKRPVEFRTHVIKRAKIPVTIRDFAGSGCKTVSVGVRDSIRR